jgi:hypothetical protein
LWDLAEKFYGDPFLWRYIWEHNQYIADPHWIYPGNPLYIPGLPRVPETGAISLYDTTKSLPQLNEQVRKTLSKYELFLLDQYRYFISLEAQRQIPFIHEYSRKGRYAVDGAITPLGEVADSDRPILVQNQNALVKVDFNRNHRAKELVTVGAQLGFYSIRKDLKSRKGVIIEPVAMGTVKVIDKDYTTIYIDKLWGMLSEGAVIAEVRPYKSLGTFLTYKPLTDSLEALTVARMNPEISIKPYETLFIDKGHKNGVMMGDHFVFYEKSRAGSSKKRDDKMILEALTVNVQENTATLRVTTARDLTSSDLFYGVRHGRVVSKD